MSERAIGVALLGCGVVGGGVLRILEEQAELIARRTGVRFDLRHVALKDLSERADRPDLPRTTDAKAAIDDPKVQLVVELIGGTGVAGDFIQRALSLGKPCVTANKSLLAARGPELFALARKHQTCIGFEASCGGGIPIIAALTGGLLANRIDALLGIVNGTCNVILTRMTRNGWSYAEALAEAQKLGFAEADPTLDVSGRDAAQKLAILGSLAFNARIAESDIHVEGIDSLQSSDIAMAGELGYVIKLLAIAERAADDQISLRVHPTLVHKDDMLAEVSGSFNAISVYGHALGHALFYGRGAGSHPTASAVVSDMLGIALGTTPAAFSQLRVLPDCTAPAKVLPFDELQSRYYARIMAKDQPGVMAQIAAALGEAQISLSTVLQRETHDEKAVPIVITTHLAREGSMREAMCRIDVLPTVSAPSVCLRIIDQPQEFASG